MKLHVPPDWKLPPELTHRLGDTAGRQRAMAADGHLLVILHGPSVAGSRERAARLFWRAPDGRWQSPTSPDGLPVLKKHVAAFAERVEGLEQQWQVAETAADYFALLQALAPLHRTARNLLATLQQARELAPADRDLIGLRDQAGEVERTVELLHGDARNGLDFTIAHQAERQADRTYDMAVSAHRLNLLAAVFFPAATVSAIFGMNLAHGLEAGGLPPWVIFWGVLAVGLACGVVLARVIARKPARIIRPARKGRAGGVR